MPSERAMRLYAKKRRRLLGGRVITSSSFQMPMAGGKERNSERKREHLLRSSNEVRCDFFQREGMLKFSFTDGYRVREIDLEVM